MRQSEIPYVYATEAVNIWLDGGDAHSVTDRAPEELRELIRYSARCQAQLIQHWAKKQRRGYEVPKAFHEQVKRYLEARKK